jgi:hypothetical protein
MTKAPLTIEASYLYSNFGVIINKESLQFCMVFLYRQRGIYSQLQSGYSYLKQSEITNRYSPIITTRCQHTTGQPTRYNEVQHDEIWNGNWVDGTPKVNAIIPVPWQYIHISFMCLERHSWWPPQTSIPYCNASIHRTRSKNMRFCRAPLQEFIEQ